MPADWSREEVEVIVTDYLAMLEAELKGVPFDKTAHRRSLMSHLNARSEGSIEFKHQNISAVLIHLGVQPIEGYKPRHNYQQLLEDVVAEQVAQNPGLRHAAAEDADRDVPALEVVGILDCLASPPAPSPHESIREGRRGTRPAGFDYLQREAANRALGRRGEEFVILYERERLLRLRKESLAERIEHIAVTRGDSEGFDVLSFDATGRERFIEVKSTKYGKETPFFVSSNELKVSESKRHAYHIYRVFQLKARPRMYQLHGAISSTCSLDATAYIARIA